eukprot:UN31976
MPETNKFNFVPDKLDPGQLRRIVSSNPFVTMGMSYENKKLVFNATKSSTNPLTAKLMSLLPYAKSKLWISEDLQDISVEVSGKMYKPHDKGFDENLRVFITSLMYFFEFIHATMHVYAYIMLGAANQATVGTDLQNFMDQYQDKILTKYLEVAFLLLNKGGLVTGGYWKVNDEQKAVNASTYVFKYLANAKNAKEWFNKIFLAGCPKLIHNVRILPEARPYVSMMESLAFETNSRIPKIQQKIIDKGLVKYFSLTGGKKDEGHFKITNFW